RVWAFDLSEGQWKLRDVLETYEYIQDEFVELHVMGEKLISTAHHPFWVIEGDDLDDRPRPDHITAAEESSLPSRSKLPGRWVDAADLQVGDVLFRKADGPAAISRVNSFQERQPVYNFAVDDLHCYAVGQGELFVHNNCGDDLVQLQLRFGDDAHGVSIKSERALYKESIGDIHHIASDKNST